jgi:hypothetical protein
MDRRESQPVWSRFSRLLLLTVPVILSSACDRTTTLRPTDEVYENAQEGFRIKPPSGWTQQAVSNSPTGPVKHEHLVTKFKRGGNGKPAFLHVSMIDLPPHKTSEAYLAESAGDKTWRPVSTNEPMEVDGVSAVRRAYSGRWDRQSVIKEVVAVQRGTRVYLFTGFVPATDAKARADVRAAVASVIWEKGDKARR